MIVLDNKETEEKVMKKDNYEMTLEELFRREIDAYCAYKDWAEATQDDVLEMALEEIMMDEYLHAKFLRDYMMDKDMYTVSSEDPHEKKFWKIHKKFFRS